MTGIIQLPTILPAQVGIVPQMKRMVTTDNLATITAAGYLNSVDLQSNPIQASDVLDVLYSFNQQTNSGTFGIFTVSISNGVITLNQWANPGDVLLPVVSGDFAVFNGTSGQIKDSGSAPSAAAQPFVVTSPGSLTTNHIAQFSDANGTLKDGGVLGTAAAKAASDNTKATLASVSATVVSGNLAKFADTAGTVADQGIAFKSVAQAAVAGGAAAQTVTDAFCTSAACVVATWNDTTNAVSIQKVAAGNGSFVVTSSADPGASHLNYFITK
jgi:hypothetical protein